MQSYSNPSQRNTIRSAGAPKPMSNQNPNTKHPVSVAHKGPATGNKIVEKVSVPLPGTNKTQSKETGGVKKAASGFNGGLINGKI